MKCHELGGVRIKCKKISVIILLLLFSLLMIGAVSAASDTNTTAISSDVSDTHTTHTDTNTQVDKTNNNNNNVNINEDITTDEKSSTNTKIKTENTKLSATRNYKLKENDETSFKSLNTTIYDNINTGTYTIDLKSNYTYQTNDGEDLKKGITIDGTKLQGQTLTINGNGHTIDGSNEARIFNVTNGAQLRLINITLTKGKGQYTYIKEWGNCYVGGAIYTTDNCNITITDSKITHNNAKHYGGAIYTWNSQINITHTNINHNNATYRGGAIFAEYNSQINITHTNINHNNATYGGAIYTWNSQVNINNTNITQNNANNGGAILADYNSHININNTNITQNNANNGNGGAIYATSNSQVNMSYTSFIKNTAKGTDIYYGGGAIYAGSNSIMAVSSSLFMNNTASNNRGAIYGNDFKNLTVNNNIFLNNTENKEIYLYKYYTDVVFDYDLGCNWFGNNETNYKNLNKDDIIGIEGAELKFDTWLFLTADSAPVTVLSNSNITFKLSLYNSTKTDNKVSNFDNNRLYPVNLTVTYVNGTGDKSVRLGSNVTFKADTVGTGSVTANISNVKYTQKIKTVLETSFSALYNNITKSQNGQLTLTHNYTYDDRTDRDLITGIPINKTITINGNGYAIDGNNTARIFNITNQAKVTINNITLTKGKGQYTYIEEWGHYYVGGAIYATDNCNVTITDSKITHNNADYGGAIFTDNSQININNTNINNNTANSVGGAILAWNSHINITHTNITQNNATVDGGAILAYNSQININNTNITHNNATSNGGAIYATSNSQVNMSYTSFIKNTAKSTSYGGGAIYAGPNSIMVVSSSLFMNNTASKDGGAIYGYDFNNLTVNNNIFLNNTGNKEIYLYKRSNVDFEYDFDCNWFGNTNDNYTIKPSVAGMELDNWLFLNAISNPDPVTVLSASNITFKLFLYNKTAEEDIHDYDNSQLKMVNLTVNNEKSRIDKSIVVLGEAIPYNTPNTIDSDSISANIENIITYTFNFDIKQKEVNTIIKDLKVDSTLYKDKPSLIEGYLYNTTGLGNQNITLKITYSSGNPEIYHLTTDKNGKFNKTITPTITGQVKIEAIYNGNITNQYIYNASNDTKTSNIVKVTYNITFDKLEPSYDYNTTVTITGTVTTNYQTLDVTNVTISLNKGEGETVGLNNGRFIYTFNGTIGGLNNITVTCKDATNTTQVRIKYPTNFTITVSNSTTDEPITVTVKEDNKFTGTINVNINGTDYEVTLNEGIGTSNPITLTQGTYNATINYSGNETYNATTTTSDQFTIKYPTTFTIQNIPDITEGDNLELSVTEENKYTGPVIIIIGSETYTVNMINGNGKLSINPKLNPGTYTAKIDFKGNENYTNATATSNQFKINSKPLPPTPTPTGKVATKILAKQKTFKLETKNKKYTITLKDTHGNTIKKAKVTLKVKGKTYKATTNNKGKATFKITKLNKKGKYTAKITYKGNKNYKKSTKKVKLTIKPFKKIGKGSKDKKTVKKIQKALKKNGYYRYAENRYLKIDGKYHKWTYRAVKKYQKDNKLPATGKVDYNTAIKLGII